MAITFTEQKRNKPHWSGWHGGEVDHIDTYFTTNGKTLFLRGAIEGSKDYSDTKEMEELKQQVIDNDAKFVRFYCGWMDYPPLGNPSPIDFINWVKKNNYHWGHAYNCKIRWFKSLQAWHFNGNLEEVSCAFDFKIWDRSLAMQVKKQMQPLYLA